MGLSVAISGGIILTVFVLLLLSLPGLADKMFSIGDITTQVTQHEQKISNTEISMNYLSQSVGSPRINFTLGNDGSEKLWNYDDFDLFIEYDGAISGKITQQLPYNGECLGTVPPAGNWCIQSISNDVADPKILNSGEQASIWTNLNENLASKTAIITLVTDNGVTFTTARDLITTITSDTTLTVNEETILVNPSTTAFTVTLPAVSGNAGKHYLIKYVATTGTVVTIDGNGAETINGKTTVKLEHPYSQWELWTDGVAWYGQYTDSILPSENYIVLQDEFFSGTGAEASRVFGELEWIAAIAGTTGDSGDIIDGELDHPGIFNIGTGTTIGNDWTIASGQTATLNFFEFDNTYEFTTLVRVPNITTLTVRIGITENSTPATWETVDNASFLFDPAVSADWRCRTFNGASETTNSGIAVNAGSWYKLKIIKDGGTIRFLIDDVNVCNHSAQVPNEPADIAFSVETGAAATRQLQIDYAKIGLILDR
jgi:hypothetical protein